MNVGMLWYSPKPVETRVAEAVAYYRKKYGREPDTAFVSPKLLDGRDALVNGISVRPMRMAVSLSWIGVEDAAEGVERESQQLLEMAEAAR